MSKISIIVLKYCNVDGQSVAKQRLDKQTSTIGNSEHKHGDIESLLPGNATVDMHPKQLETVFSMGSVQRS
jgi:hypothetical protein